MVLDLVLQFHPGWKIVYTLIPILEDSEGLVWRGIVSINVSVVFGSIFFQCQRLLVV